MRTVHVVVPDTVDDPGRPSGGNTYDQRVCAGLVDAGWGVTVHRVAGAWPHAAERDRIALAVALRGLPDGCTVALDGLVATGNPEVVVPESTRLQVVVVVHLPLGVSIEEDHERAAGMRGAERAVLASAAAVVATSGWTRRWLLDHYALDAARVHVAEPGVDGAAVAPGTLDGESLLCVAAVVPAKGHDQLFDALARVRDLPWRLTCVGAVDLEPGHLQRLLRRSEEWGIADRVAFVGPHTPRQLERRYAAADLLVHASRLETYGLVVTEALARGLPVVATSVGGVPRALGRAPDGTRPGRLVAAGDVVALAGAVRAWLGDPDVRRQWRHAALGRRTGLESWATTAGRVAAVLDRLVADP